MIYNSRTILVGIDHNRYDKWLLLYVLYVYYVHYIRKLRVFFLENEI